MACLIHLCLEEFSMNAIISPRDDLKSTIWPCVPGETIDHWIVKPYFVVAPGDDLKSTIRSEISSRVHS